MNLTASTEPSASQILSGGGEMGALMRSLDWSLTPVGPVETWPQSLRTSVSILLHSRHPMMVMWGPEMIQFYNDSFRPILGVSKHPEALGQRARDCWQEIWPIVGTQLEGVLERGEEIWFEDLLVPFARYGHVEEIYFTYSYSAIRNESGQIGGILVVCTETTQHVIAERQLRTLRDIGTCAVQERFEQKACQAVLECLSKNPHDLPFGLLYLNNAENSVAHLMGAVGVEENQPISPTEIRLAEPDQSVWPLVTAAHSAELVIVDNLQECFGVVPPGPWPEPPHTAAVIPLLASGQVIGFLVGGVSARRRLNDDYRGFLELCAAAIGTAIVNARAFEASRQRAELLDEMNQAKTTFFSNISHEFRTPLTLMLGPLEHGIQSSGASVSIDRETAQIMYRNMLRLLKLVNTLLDFSRLEAGRMQASFEPTDLALLTTEITSSFESAIEQAGLEFVVNCPPLPEPIFVDREMWEKILLNLLSNALKFTHTGSISVSLRLEEGRAILKVGDTGIGIPQSEIPHIFERFYRVRDTTARTYEGTGIGLSLVQELVQLHGGSVKVESQQGLGTTFSVEIPTGSTHLPAEYVQARASQVSTASSPSAYVMQARGWSEPADASDLLEEPDRMGELPPGRLLIVDDNADMRQYLRRLLQPFWKTDTATDGLAALSLIEQRIPDLILTDVMMPQMDGFTFLRKLRENPATLHVPVIMLSARAGEEALVEGLTASANDYLIKPFSAQQLIARVRTQLITAKYLTELNVAKQQLAETLAHTRELYEISRQIVLATSIDEILTAVRTSAFFRTSQTAGIFWFDEPWIDQAPEYGNILCYWTADKRETDLTGVHFEFEKYGLTRLAAPDCAIFIPDSTDPQLTQAVRDVFIAIKSRSIMTLPLIAQGLCRGEMFAHWHTVQHFTENDIHAMQQIVDLAAAAIHNILLLRQEASARELAEQANELKLRFMGMISHELRTPLTSIKGFATTLLSPDVNFEADQQREFVEIINEETDKLMNLIEHLLDLTRIQAGTFAVNLEPVSVQDIVASAMAELKALCENHTLEIRLPERLPPVLGDKHRIGQVLTNLVHNACKFAPTGTAVMLMAHQEHGFIQIDVLDEGPGIPEDQRDQIFEAFLQLRGTNRPGIRGLGLGLTIAKGLIEAHGGRIWVQDRHPSGTIVSFTVPMSSRNWQERL